MVGNLRVPLCFLTRRPYSWDTAPKFDLFTCEKIKKNYSIIPLLVLKACVLLAIPTFCFHRFFFTKIEVQIRGHRRFEITSPPGFFDLRNPRILKIWKLRKLKPAIQLDNRYRLMRKEPMLDADGKETDDIGPDDTAPPTLAEGYAIMEEKGWDYFSPEKLLNI
ncbi:uncharacterized protein LOC107998450 [Apis cerana]|uniref:uncharacterized protein LOC107998450 n=1 Tax=Apis cerana TaxID=7461 RepID=UPI0007E2B2A5|nr:uncharacterized protein LOC107998450 [Apis cerana]